MTLSPAMRLASINTSLADVPAPVPQCSPSTVHAGP
jgi:hypothetical protein